MHARGSEFTAVTSLKSTTVTPRLHAPASPVPFIPTVFVTVQNLCEMCRGSAKILPDIGPQTAGFGVQAGMVGDGR